MMCIVIDIDAVADGHSLDSAEVEQLADGRVFTGNKPSLFLLVDDIGICKMPFAWPN